MRRVYTVSCQYESGLRSVRLTISYLITFALMLLAAYGCSGGGHFTSVRAEGNAVRIPIQDVNDGNVHFYEFRLGEKRIHFFVRSDGSGQIRVHFDACRTCFRHHKGYRQEGTDIVCNECGYKFRLADEEWKDIDGCTPIGLPHTEDGSSITILVSDLRKGMRFFE